jgi:excinuclease ABC subunit C
LGKEAVGAVISFSVSEGFVKKNYRAYGIKSTQVGDDYQMLREFFFKRFNKHKLPDLIIVDGGLAHLKTAISSIKEIYGENFDDFEIISIAKGEKRNDGLETIFLKSGASLKTTHEDPKIHFLQRLRDEAHRFGIKKHRELRNKKSFL